MMYVPYFCIVVTIRWKVRFSEGFAEKQCEKPREHFALRLVDILRHCFYLSGLDNHIPLDRRTIGCPLLHSEIQKWIETFMGYGRQGLRANPKNAESLYEEELKAHREKIGELVLQIDVLKKAKKILEEPEEENSSSE
jgi:hypothetical protein